MVDHEAFLKRFGHGKKAAQHGGILDIGLINPRDIARTRGCTTPKIELSTAEKVLKTKLATQFDECAKAFRSFDYDHNGTVSFEEFRKLLHRFNISLHNESQERLLFNAVDPDGSGEIDYREFLAHYGFELKPKETAGIGVTLHNVHDKRAITRKLQLSKFQSSAEDKAAAAQQRRNLRKGPVSQRCTRTSRPAFAESRPHSAASTRRDWGAATGGGMLPGSATLAHFHDNARPAKPRKGKDSLSSPINFGASLRLTSSPARHPRRSHQSSSRSASSTYRSDVSQAARLWNSLTKKDNYESLPSRSTPFPMFDKIVHT